MTMLKDAVVKLKDIGLNLSIEEIKSDYRICCISREVSLLARKEVLTGKAKFGIIGDGKEVPQVAMARAFQKGDFRSGYYRDQVCAWSLFYRRLFCPTVC